VNQGGSPIYTVRGAPPRPAPVQGPGRSVWRGPLILVAVMMGWMLFNLALAGFAAPSGSASVAPMQLGQGVTLTPAEGWTSAADVWDVGEDAVSLKRAGALVAFAAQAYEGTADELLAFELSDLESQFDSYRALPAAQSTIAGDLPALTALFSGTSNSSRLEGELVAATSKGTGVLMLAVAPAGQLPRVQADIDTMLDALVVPR
jgi:hypothetical protein